MGKGDKRTRRGKIFAGSYGNSRKSAARIRSAKKSASSAKRTTKKR